MREVIREAGLTALAVAGVPGPTAEGQEMTRPGGAPFQPTVQFPGSQAAAPESLQVGSGREVFPDSQRPRSLTSKCVLSQLKSPPHTHAHTHALWGPEWASVP